MKVNSIQSVISNKAVTLVCTDPRTLRYLRGVYNLRLHRSRMLTPPYRLLCRIIVATRYSAVFPQRVSSPSLSIDWGDLNRAPQPQSLPSIHTRLRLKIPDAPSSFLLYIIAKRTNRMHTHKFTGPHIGLCISINTFSFPRGKIF
jgi:hypothetical protein